GTVGRFPMATTTLLEREEYIEQAYFFRVLRERLAENVAAQEVLQSVHEEILSTTRLPFAIQFLATELKHSGLLSSGFARLPHYFPPSRASLAGGTDQDPGRSPPETALQIREREAISRAGQPTPSGLFIYQFETLSRNRLGYDPGLASIAGDPFYDAVWREYI